MGTALIRGCEIIVVSAAIALVVLSIILATVILYVLFADSILSGNLGDVRP